MITKITHYLLKKNSYQLTLIDLNYNQKTVILDKNNPWAADLYDQFKKQNWIKINFFEDDPNDIEDFEVIKSEDQKKVDEESIKLRGGIYGRDHFTS